MLALIGRGANGKGNPESHSNLFQRGFYPALRRAKLRKIRFHDLRHTFCSLLIKNREDPKRIQRLMGHSSIGITFDIYGYLFPDEGEDVASRLEDLVTSNSDDGDWSLGWLTRRA